MSGEGEVSKKLWTDEERLELASKLDEELNDFIDGLEKKRYTEGWPEDRWEEEMDKHPFFMKKAPQPGDEVHPMFEGLQKLKYDPQENTNEELALNYKEDGNFYMKHKKFRMAIYSFTEGIKAKCINPEVLAVLYNNRSAAHFFLQNYRSSLNDAQKALEYKADYTKARQRAAQCAHKLGKFDLCSQLCDELLEQNADNTAARQLLQENKAKKLDIERQKRKEIIDERKRLATFDKLCRILTEQGVKFDDMKSGASITEELLKPKFEPLENFPVCWNDKTNHLDWPVAFSYPEFGVSEFLQSLAGIVVLEDAVRIMLAEPLPYDKDNKYNLESINVYYENRKVGCVHKVDLSKTIDEIIKEKGFYVTGGSLLFYVVLKDSEVEQKYINEKRRPLTF